MKLSIIESGTTRYVIQPSGQLFSADGSRRSTVLFQASADHTRDAASSTSDYPRRDLPAPSGQPSPRPAERQYGITIGSDNWDRTDWIDDTGRVISTWYPWSRQTLGLTPVFPQRTLGKFKTDDNLAKRWVDARPVVSAVELSGTKVYALTAKGELPQPGWRALMSTSCTCRGRHCCGSASARLSATRTVP